MAESQEVETGWTCDVVAWHGISYATKVYDTRVCGKTAYLRDGAGTMYCPSHEYLAWNDTKPVSA